MFPRKRDVIHIVTWHKTNRTCLLKNKKQLEALPDKSDDIYMNSPYEKYSMRPVQLSNWSFADFVTKINILNRKQNDALSMRLYTPRAHNFICQDQHFVYKLRKQQRILRYFCPPEEDNSEDS